MILRNIRYFLCFQIHLRAIPHNSKCRYGERGAAAAKPKAQIILDAAKVSAASGGNSEPKQGQRSQSARGFCPRSAMRVPQPDIIEHFGNADAVPQLPERCLSRKEGIMRYCPRFSSHFDTVQYDRKSAGSLLLWHQSGFAFPVHIAQVNAVCQNAARKAGVRRCTGCAGFVTISIMLLMDPAVDAVGGWTMRTMYQRSCSAHLSVPVLPYHSAALTRTKIFTAAKKCCILRCKDTLEKILWTGSKCYE